jgi:hypothetical protein
MLAASVLKQQLTREMRGVNLSSMVLACTSGASIPASSTSREKILFVAGGQEAGLPSGMVHPSGSKVKYASKDAGLSSRPRASHGANCRAGGRDRNHGMGQRLVPEVKIKAE